MFFFNDLIKSVKNHRYWFYAGYLEYLRKFRRSKLGPIWSGMNILIFIFSIGLVWSYLWKISLIEYLPHFSAGVIFWSLVTLTFENSSVIYLESKETIKSIKINLFDFYFQKTFLIFLNFIQSFLILLLVLFYFIDISPLGLLLTLFNLIIVFLNIFLIIIWSSILFLYFDDLKNIATQLIRILFLVTPIIWKEELIGEYSVYLKFNIFYSFIEILRAPLLNNPFTHHYVAILVFTLINFFISVLVFNKNYKKVIFYL